MIWLDGEFVAEPPPDTGVVVFETLGAFGGELRLWSHHSRRLDAARARLGDTSPWPVDLRLHAEQLLRQNGDDVLRLECRIAGRADGAAPSWCLVTRRRATNAIVRLLPTIARRAPSSLPADLKARPRPFYDQVLIEAQRGGADDGIALGDDGALLETAHGNLWLLLDSVWTTPPLDGRVLPGVARELLLCRARTNAVPVAERRLDLADLHRAEMIAVSNAVHGPRQGALQGTAVAECGSSLARLWRMIVAN